MARVLLGVGGGIAAYKSVVVARRLREAGHEVRAIPTRAALEFVGAATWEAITGQPATCDVFADSAGVDHVRLGAGADLVLVAPATADLLARAAAGLADDLLTTTLLAASAPVWFFPAMHSAMWLAAPTQANVATLRARGARVPDPATGRLTGADSGPGRMAEPEEIVALALAQLDR
ncbi:MAG: phosphopantothenoylcysteine decarboxylase, partial [Bifidobacteriaceae bacterium]|nr:phosphopantothenoylcysteine decarboxylase [Bifidobacteriaceae bacterium]